MAPSGASNDRCLTAGRPSKLFPSSRTLIIVSALVVRSRRNSLQEIGRHALQYFVPKDGTRQQAYRQATFGRKRDRRRGAGPRGLARRGGEEDRRAYPAGAHGAHAVDRRSGRQALAAATVRAFRPDRIESRPAAWAGDRRGGGVPHHAAAPRFAASGTAQPALAAADEADQIADPGMRRIYRSARKKALA